VTRVVSLAAYVYGSIRTDGHQFDEGFAFLLFLADVVVAGAVVPSAPLVG